MTLAPLQLLMGHQALGADPTANAWLSASAGTGKTQVLTARVLRLLLAGNDPGAILSLTFTKAGASEMARRIRERLALWVQMSEQQLARDLRFIHVEDAEDPTVRRYARTLFARVIDAPGRGLAIQTIHSFCQSLLSSFPDEAGLAPGFRAMEDREMALLREDVLARLIDDAPGAGEGWFLDALGSMALRLSEGGAISYLHRCIPAHATLASLPQDVSAWLRARLALPAGDPARWLEAQCADDVIDQAGWLAIAAANASWGTKTGLNRADAIAAWLALAPPQRAAQLDLLLETVQKKDGGLRSDYTSGKALGEVADLAARQVAALGGAQADHRQMHASDEMAECLTAGRHFSLAYAARKRRDGLVDYDDLIARTVALIAGEGRSEWIRYKLDARIDHILVDEAQDTNEAQWAIIRALSEEYFAGDGTADEVLRTLFVVGDYKQAIYGFQGTNPEHFAQSRHDFGALGDAAQRPFADLSIDTNFRSSAPVLRVVDRVIAAIGPAQMGLDVDAVRHTAHAADAPGRVVLWPLQVAGDAARPSDGAGEGSEGGSDAGGDEGSEEAWIDSATRVVADKIARTVRHWIDEGLDGQPVHAGDVMVLVRKRADIAGLIVSRLQSHGVPVAGVDRMRLQSPLAVQDILSAARFALQPLDDLNLAHLLVSPLIGWSHEALFDRGYRAGVDGRSTRHLWPHLRDNDALRDDLAPLRAILRMSGFVTPHRFFETLLSGPLQGRAKLLERLGNAARDPIEELLSQALAFETREGTSLHQFLRWFDRGAVDIKREADSDADEVRVMTVHGAKGLQARIVILADAAVDPERGHAPELGLPAEEGMVPLSGVRKETLPAVLERVQTNLKEQDMREHWRLLYVAMTRAERMLFVCGKLGARKAEAPSLSWYQAVENVLGPLGSAWQADESVWGQSLAYTDAGRGRESRAARAAPPVVLGAALPAWVSQPAPEEARPPRPLAPSAQEEADALTVAQPPAAGSADRAAERGRLMHSLFERLPAVAPDARAAVALQWLARQAPHLGEDALHAMVAPVLGVLEDPAYASLFGVQSLAELPFSALVDGRVIAGTIDRLVVLEDRILLVDYKTGAAVPQSAERVPVGYLRQMAAYCAALSVIFPGRVIEATLLFTAGPRSILLPSALLDQHKPAFQADKAISAAGA